MSIIYKYIQNMKNFKYFRWGYPKVDSDSVYAIYQPLLNCFLTIVDNKEIATQIKYLLTSRYTTAVIRIDQATNYNKNLVDNSICESWTLKNTNDVQTFTLYETEHKIVCAETLIPNENKLIAWDLEQEKQWIFLCQHWLYFFESLKWQYKYFDVDNFLKPLIGPQTKYFPDEFRQEVLKELYLGQDFDRVDKLLLEKMQSQKALQTFWKSYLDDLQ